MIGFLHTAAIHVPGFDALVAARDPTVATTSIVRSDLLDRARSVGLGDPGLAPALDRSFQELIGSGASVIVCTCSTLAGLAEEIGRSATVPVVRIDRPMAERAVAAGRRISVVAALASTLDPTRTLLGEVGQDLGIEISVTTWLVPGAWERFESGDQAGYLEAVASTCRVVAAHSDAIVLAQASMADAADLVADVVDIPVLSSPVPAVDAAIALHAVAR